LDDAKKEALENAETAVAELNELGFHYSVVEGASKTTVQPTGPIWQLIGSKEQDVQRAI
jgi:hypothetical protein